MIFVARVCASIPGHSASCTSTPAFINYHAPNWYFKDPTQSKYYKIPSPPSLQRRTPQGRIDLEVPLGRPSQSLAFLSLDPVYFCL